MCIQEFIRQVMQLLSESYIMIKNTNEYVDLFETKEETQLFEKNYIKRINKAKNKKKIKYYTDKIYKIPNKLFK